MAYIACLNLLKIEPDNPQALELRDDIIIKPGIDGLLRERRDRQHPPPCDGLYLTAF
jgi:hypothetical protein